MFSTIIYAKINIEAIDSFYINRRWILIDSTGHIFKWLLHGHDFFFLSIDLFRPELFSVGPTVNYLPCNAGDEGLIPDQGTEGASLVAQQ